MPDLDESLVIAKDLAKRYGDFIALHPLDVKVSSGEFFGVFGPNGAGKSTFIKLLTGQLRPSFGAVEVLGINAAEDPQNSKPTLALFLNRNLHLHILLQVSFCNSLVNFAV